MEECNPPAPGKSLLQIAASAASTLLGHVCVPAPYATADAFRRLYEQTHRSVYHYIYSLHGGPMEDVEDLAAETFMRAWNSRGRFRGDDAAAVGWLITIARNLVIDAQRVRRRHGLACSIDDPALEVLSEVSIESQVLSNEQHAALLAALQSLVVHERELLVLRYMLGWQVKRIAEHYGIPENTTSVQIRRALERLRRCWSVNEETHE